MEREEREREIAKLVNVLRRTARMAMQSELTGVGQESASFAVQQYNRVLNRLKEIDSSVGAVFEPLPAGSSLAVAAMASRQLAAYYEDEVGCGRPYGLGVSFDAKAFKDFWSKAGQDIEDLGEFIRESIQEWARHRKRSQGKPEC